MSRYILPLSILAVIALLIGLIAFRGNGNAIDYSMGMATEQPLSAEWVRGASSSPVVLVEYSDFQCPACKAYLPLLEAVEQKYADRVSFVYRHYPLPQHPNAYIAARAAEAAGLQGKFWEMHDKLFGEQESWSVSLSPMKHFEKYASELSLDVVRFATDMESSVVKKNIADDYARGQKDGIGGTPTFILNGVRLPQNPGSVEAFDQLFTQLIK